tara:strand:+ start:151 stop:591 length:441 start_codon:yes stop_codon:yes gene_type:complete
MNPSNYKESELGDDDLWALGSKGSPPMSPMNNSEGWYGACEVDFKILQEENKKLKEENEKLKDFTNWENHPALKHKVVLDDDYYLEHLSDGELIHPDEIKKLLKFICGNEEASVVEEIIRGEMNKEFIDANQEQWDQMELFQDSTL